MTARPLRQSRRGGARRPDRRNSRLAPSESSDPDGPGRTRTPPVFATIAVDHLLLNQSCAIEYFAASAAHRRRCCAAERYCRRNKMSDATITAYRGSPCSDGLVDGAPQTKHRRVASCDEHARVCACRRLPETVFAPDVTGEPSRPSTFSSLPSCRRHLEVERMNAMIAAEVKIYCVWTSDSQGLSSGDAGDRWSRPIS